MANYNVFNLEINSTTTKRQSRTDSIKLSSYISKRQRQHNMQWMNRATWITAIAGSIALVCLVGMIAAELVK